MAKKLDEMHWHEALDRTYLCEMFITEHLLKHPAIEGTPSFRTRVLDAIDLLQQVYQRIPDHPDYR